MATPSIIDRMPLEVREALEGWLRDPIITRAEATRLVNEKLEEMGLCEMQVTRQTVSRHGRLMRAPGFADKRKQEEQRIADRHERRMRETGERLRRSRLLAESLVGKAGMTADGEMSNLVNEMLRTLAFDLAYRLRDAALDDEKLPGVVEAAVKVSLMAQRLERSSEIAARRERETERQDAEEKAAQAERESQEGQNAAAPDLERLREIVRGVYGYTFGD